MSDELEKNWVLAENLSQGDYILFRTDEPLTSEINTVLVEVRTLTRYVLIHHKNDAGEPIKSLIPKTALAKEFNLIDHW